MKLLVFEYGQFKHAQREITKGSFAGCHTRWRGLECHLYNVTGSDNTWAYAVIVLGLHNVQFCTIYLICEIFTGKA